MADSFDSGTITANSADLTKALSILFAELVDGVSEREAYMLNRGDPGLLRSLDKLSSLAASARTPTGSTIAAHVNHLRYGLSLLNRWSAGENSFENADWTAAWRNTRVTGAEWKELREQLAEETHRWLENLGKPRQVDQSELNTIIGSIAHLAYHLGAIRQIDRTAGGPSATA
jgi:hypothetical protein